jgi:hypothetical protein
MIMKLDLLTNATVVHDAIRFVSEKGVGAVAAKPEPKVDVPTAIQEKKLQEEQEQNNKWERELDNNDTTVNQVF